MKQRARRGLLWLAWFSVLVVVGLGIARRVLPVREDIPAEIGSACAEGEPEACTGVSRD